MHAYKYMQWIIRLFCFTIYPSVLWNTEVSQTKDKHVRNQTSSTPGFLFPPQGSAEPHDCSCHLFLTTSENTFFLAGI